MGKIAAMPEQEVGKLAAGELQPICRAIASRQNNPFHLFCNPFQFLGGLTLWRMGGPS